jgi:hypothetical protein
MWLQAAMQFLREEIERQTKLEGLAPQTPTTTANLISLLCLLRITAKKSNRGEKLELL